MVPTLRTPAEEALVQRLRAIRDQCFEVDEREAFPIALEIHDHLGSPDPELRDELGITILGTWIVDQGRAAEVFQAEEDERIAIALAAMLSSGQLSAPRLLAFLDERDLSERDYRTSWKHILRSLHFRLDGSQAEARRELERAQGELARR